MPEKILKYFVIEFPTAAEASTIAVRIMDFLVSEAGAQWGLDPNRAVIWTGPSVSKEGVLYMSAGALAASEAAGFSPQPSAALAAADLPVDKALLYGDAADWY